MTYDEVERGKKIMRKFLKIVYSHACDAIELGTEVNDPLVLVQEVIEFLDQMRELHFDELSKLSLH
jgi:hypothetical protein